MSRILVTGASGFLGKHIVPRLIDRGHEVHTLSRNPLTARQTATANSNARICHHQLSLFEGAAIERVMKTVRPTHLLHLAWFTTAGSFWAAPENEQWAEVSKTLFEQFAQAGGQRIVGLGSCAEYEWGDIRPLHEFHSPIQPATLYGQCKVRAHSYLKKVTEAHGISSAWGRVFFLYGPGASDQRIPGSLLTSLLAGQRTPAPAGDQIRDFLYIRDAAEAIVRLLQSNVTGPVNIASGYPLMLRDLMRQAAIAAGHPDLLEIGAIPGRRENNPHSIAADVHRLTWEVGFRAPTSLEQGLRETVQSMTMQSGTEAA